MRIFILFIIYFILCSCKTSSKFEISSSNKSYIFPGSLLKNRYIIACFSAPAETSTGTVTAHISDKTKAIIEETLSVEYAKAGIFFVGFLPCNSPHSYSREYNTVEITRVSPRYVEIYVPDAFAYTTSSLSRDGKAAIYIQTDCFENLSLCNTNLNFMKYVLLHEVGHLLGAMHEHERDDRSTCESDANGLPYPHNKEGIKMGEYDPNSIMNYCSGNGTLSQLDIAGFSEYYRNVIASVPRQFGSLCSGIEGFSFGLKPGDTEEVCRTQDSFLPGSYKCIAGPTNSYLKCVYRNNGKAHWICRTGSCIIF